MQHAMTKFRFMLRESQLSCVKGQKAAAPSTKLGSQASNDGNDAASHASLQHKPVRELQKISVNWH